MKEEKKKTKTWFSHEDVEKAVEPVEMSHNMIAKRDFVLSHNDYKREIKAGEDVSDVPVMYHANLKTEKVI